jgi:homoserine acetyltransferase
MGGCLKSASAAATIPDMSKAAVRALDERLGKIQLAWTLGILFGGMEDLYFMEY